MPTSQHSAIKTILCYGDSNTWGDPPGSVGRHPFAVRWPGKLEHLLGAGYRIAEEGLCGRTTCREDPATPFRDGLAYLPVALEAHCPLWALIIMLGTNDLKECFGVSAEVIADGVAELVRCAKRSQFSVEHILLLAPPLVSSTADPDIRRDFKGGIEKSARLSPLFAEVAAELDCDFFDAARVAKSSRIDGIHLDQENHASLAQGLSHKLRTLAAKEIGSG